VSEHEEADGALDVVGVGNALVDVLSHEEDAVVTKLGLERGVMTMVDHDEAERVYAAQGPSVELSGGSAANTIAGLASFGATAGFIGKVGNDAFGDVFAHDLAALGVQFSAARADGSGPTGRCHVIVTPDADRTMCTFLGVAGGLHRDDIDEALIGRARVTYLEGYLFDQPAAKEAFRQAAAVAHRSSRRVALSLSDPFCVHRHREEFLQLVEYSVEVLFANEEEICALYEVDDFDAALQQVRRHTDIAALTRGKHGSVIVSGDEVHLVDAVPVERLVDTTGAGDQYAAGFLYGLTQEHDLVTCGRLGSLAAGEVISHLGPRPETPLRALAAQLLG
jgi:sugar/nucleoside kinase (ribokinase family)